jgi:TatD DNase family protein
MLVDAHCHLTGEHLAEDALADTLVRARAAGVSGFIAVGTDLEDSERALKLARAIPGIQASLGLHPHEARFWSPALEAGLEALLGDPNARFVGETGLDWHYDHSPREQQETAFRAQIQLARRIGKPLMIHTRSAPEATLRILAEEAAGEVGGIIHCFSEDLPFARAALDLGFHLSFSGIVTFGRKAEAVREAARWAPEDRVLVETDAPFLAPVPKRGRTNEPAFVRYTAEELANLRGVPLARLSEQCTRNLEGLCGWSPPC